MIIIHLLLKTIIIFKILRVIIFSWGTIWNWNSFIIDTLILNLKSYCSRCLKINNNNSTKNAKYLYLKYKSKYLRLKKLYGGTDPVQESVEDPFPPPKIDDIFNNEELAEATDKEIKERINRISSKELKTKYANPYFNSKSIQ